MHMTDTQATNYCFSQAKSLTGTSHEEGIRTWSRLASEIRQDGLDAVVSRLEGEQAIDTSITETFLAAISDEEEVKRAIAGELKEKVKQEIDEKSTLHLRVIYLQYLRNHLGNVQDDAADLEDFSRARKDIETQLEQLEVEYGAWITNAIAEQEF